MTHITETKDWRDELKPGQTISNDFRHRKILRVFRGADGRTQSVILNRFQRSRNVAKEVMVVRSALCGYWLVKQVEG